MTYFRKKGFKYFTKPSIMLSKMGGYAKRFAKTKCLFDK